MAILLLCRTCRAHPGNSVRLAANRRASSRPSKSGCSSAWHAPRRAGSIPTTWLGDSLDGPLARVRNRQRPRYGFYVDHITDAFGTLFLVGGMGLSGYMSPMVAGVLLVAYFMLSIQAYLAAYALGTFQLSYWKLSPTELRLLLVAGNFALLSQPMGNLFGYRFPLFDAGGVVGIAGIWLVLIASSIRNTAALYRAERLPPL